MSVSLNQDANHDAIQDTITAGELLWLVRLLGLGFPAFADAKRRSSKWLMARSNQAAIAAAGAIRLWCSLNPIQPPPLTDEASSNLRWVKRLPAIINQAAVTSSGAIPGPGARTS
jgi:hypothetical protein